MSKPPTTAAEWTKHLKASFPVSYKNAIAKLDEDDIRHCCAAVGSSTLYYHCTCERTRTSPPCEQHMGKTLEDHHGAKWGSFTSLNQVLEFIGSNLADISSSSMHPSHLLIFEALKACPFRKIKAVIIGNEPQTTSQAKAAPTGLAFSSGSKPKSTSLKYLLVSFQNATQCTLPAGRSGDLTPWAEQGVLLLNTYLTCGSDSYSHQTVGWQLLICLILRAINCHKVTKLNMPVLILGSPATRVVKPREAVEDRRAKKGKSSHSFFEHLAFSFGPHPRRVLEDKSKQAELDKAVSHFKDLCTKSRKRINWDLGE